MRYLSDIQVSGPQEELESRDVNLYRHHQHIDNIRAMGLDGVTQGESADGEEKRLWGTPTHMHSEEDKETLLSSPFAIEQSCGSLHLVSWAFQSRTKSSILVAQALVPQ